MSLHPVFASAIRAASAAGRPAVSAGTPAEARASVDGAAAVLGAGAAVETVTDIEFPSRDGTLRARLYQPAKSAPGLVVYFHGGGWVAGSRQGFDGLARTLAARSGCAVLLVEYRLAPESPFPAAFNDAQDALRWADREKSVLASSGAVLVAAGDSAGANLAAAAVRALTGVARVDLQLLFYPVTDCDFRSPSYAAHGEGLPLTRADMQWFFSHYAPPQQWPDPRIAVSRSDLRGMPPTWIGLAGYDVLRTEGEIYAHRLSEAGVPVDCKVYPGTIHGFARWFNLVDTADSALNDAAAAIKAAANK